MIRQGNGIPPTNPESKRKAFGGQMIYTFRTTLKVKATATESPGETIMAGLLSGTPHRMIRIICEALFHAAGHT
jgi:hypothetical protein